MGWEQIYEQWKNHQQLEAGLKDQLTELEKDPKCLRQYDWLDCCGIFTEKHVGFSVSARLKGSIYHGM